MNYLTNLVQFPGLGLSFQLNRVAFTIGGVSIYWYGVCIAVGLCLALVFAFRHSLEFGVDPDSMVDVILIGVVLGIISARAYYVAMAPFKYESIWEMIAIRDGGLAIYGGVIGGFLFGGLACKWRGVPVLPMFDLTAMGFLLGQGCGRWGNFFNQEAFGCNTTPPWGCTSEATQCLPDEQHGQRCPRVWSSTPTCRCTPLFVREHLVLCGLFPAVPLHQKTQVQRRHHPAVSDLVRRRPFLDRGLRTDSLMLVPSIGLRVSQLVAGIAVVAGIAAEAYFTRKLKDKPLFVPLALNAENKAAQKKLDGPISFAGKDTQLLASSPRKLFLEKTEAYNAQVKAAIEQAGQKKA
ncbi:MAG: prolipoprotein diacylglyceryl transferase [Faecalibacterium prausnitzii]